MARALAAAMGAEGAASPGPAPLSRLPDVPSVWMRPQELMGNAPNPTVAQQAPPTMTPVPPPDVTTGNKGPGGTLASPKGRAVSEPAPQVAIVTPGTAGTLPSENLPMLPFRRGVAPWLVVVLVLGALVAGVLLGFAAARMT
jgi:hypothetical protein